MSKKTSWIILVTVIVVVVLSIIIPVYVFESPDAMIHNPRFSNRITQLTKQTRAQAYSHDELVDIYTHVKVRDTNRQVLAVARPNAVKTTDTARKAGTFVYTTPNKQEQVYLTFEDGFVNSMSYNNSKTERTTELIACGNGTVKAYRDGQVVKNKQATLTALRQ